MTQTQRKKALAEAKATVARLEREVAENEPLTEPMKKALLLIAAHGGLVAEMYGNGLSEYRAGGFSGPKISKMSIWPLQWRIMIGAEACSEGRRDGVKYALFPLTDWGRQQADALAKAKATETE